MLDAERTREQPADASADAPGHVVEDESIAPKNVQIRYGYGLSHHESLVRLYELEIDSLQKLFDFALEEALVLTKSAIGFICFYDDKTKIFTLYSWSRHVMAQCRVAGQPKKFYLDNTGLWGEVVRQRQPIVVNDFSAPHPLKRGCPEGHVGIRKYLSVPVLRQNRIVAVIAVGNKDTDYTELDVQQLDLFAKGVWVIAQRKEAEEALRVSEMRYRSVVEDQTEVISRFRPDGSLLFVNEVYCRFFGKTTEALLGEQWNPVVVPEDLPMIQRLLRSLSAENPVVTMENRVYDAQGEIRWMQFVNRAIFDDAGRMVEIQSVGRDITERKEAEAALRESELRWKFALEGSGDGVWDWDIDKNTLFFSKRCKLMLGHECHEIGDDPNEWRSRVHPDELEGSLISLHRHLRGNTPIYVKEHRLLCKDGSYKWMCSRGKVIERNAEGRALRVIGTISDITERKKLEALKEEVDKIMRHDLRSPLIGIVGLPDILLENKALGAREREILLAIQDAGCKILSMIDNSISIYKMELGSYTLNLGKENIVPMLFKTREVLGRKFKYKNINIVILVDDREGAAEDSFVIECEEEFCFTMISNLLLNAVEASPPRERIYLSLSTTSKALGIVNKGSVPVEIRERFFEKYVTAGKSRGTGLGTYSAALIARTHGWKISLDTSVAGETTVTVAF